MKYESTFLFPPRPTEAIPPALLTFYEKSGWVAQKKANGTNNVISINSGKATCWNRHGEAHLAWNPVNSKALEPLKTLPKNSYVFVGELLHSKVPTIRDTIYLHDILVHDGQQLVGKTQVERQRLLQSLMALLNPSPEVYQTHFKITENLWLTREYKTGFLKLFQGLFNPEDEGLVLKNPLAKLSPCFKETANNSSQVKCRKATKNYGF